MNGGGWVRFYSPGVDITGLNPGSTYSVVVRLVNTSTGVLTTLSSQSITLASLAMPTTSLSSALRNKATLSIRFSDTIDKYSYIIEGKSEITKNVTGSSFSLTVPEDSSNFTSNTTYKISIRGFDKSAQRWGSYSSFNFTTKAFSKPVITVVYAGLSHIILQSKINDSCSFQGIAGFTYEMKDTNYVIHKNLESPLLANTTYTPSFQYKDDYGPVQSSSVTVTTKKIDTTTLSLEDQTIKSITDPSISPKFMFSFSGEKFEKKIKMTLGSNKQQINIPKGMASAKQPATIQQVVDIVTAAKTKTYTVDYNIRYYDGGYICGTETNLSVPIYLDDVLLKAPALSTRYEDSLMQKQKLTALVNHSINKVTIIQDAPQMLLGAPISSVSVTFNGETKPLSLSVADSATFGPYREPISRLGAVFTMRDSRGLTAIVKHPIDVIDYTPPTLSIRSITRESGFGSSLVLQDVSMSYTKMRVNGLDNTVTRMTSSYIGSESSVEVPLIINDDQNLLEHLEIKPGLSGISNTEETTLGKDLEIFNSNEAYKINFRIQDRLTSDTGYEGTVLGVVISTGKPMVFFDELNRQVGINTTVPRGRLEVDGELFAGDSHFLNTIHFEFEDIE